MKKKFKKMKRKNSRRGKKERVWKEIIINKYLVDLLYLWKIILYYIGIHEIYIENWFEIESK